MRRKLSLVSLTALLLAGPGIASAAIVNTTIYQDSSYQVTTALGTSVDASFGDINVGGNTGAAAMFYFSFGGIPTNATISTVKINYRITNPLLDSTADFYAAAGQVGTNVNGAVLVGYGNVTSGGDSVNLSTPVFSSAVPGSVSVLAFADDPSGIFDMSSNASLDISYSTPAPAIPEPASLGLLALGSVMLLRRRK